MPQIVVSVESARGCGFRKPGGLYFVGPRLFESCERLPFPLTVCPCCGAGIKQGRGFTWVQHDKMFAAGLDPRCSMAGAPDTAGLAYMLGADTHNHLNCPMCSPHKVPHDRSGLMWVGAAHYTPEQFLKEANEVGVSKRIGAIPREFKIGEHLIYMAHPHGIKPKLTEALNGGEEQKAMPGVIMVFRPTAVDFIVESEDEEEIPDKALNLIKKHGKENIRLVKVIKDEPQPELEGLNG